MASTSGSRKLHRIAGYLISSCLCKSTYTAGQARDIVSSLAIIYRLRCELLEQ